MRRSKMITSLAKVLKLVDQIAPFSSAENWDNVGLLIGNPNREVDRILIALDLTEEVFEEALEEGFDTVITHHPLLFSPLKQITTETHIGKLVTGLIENKINLIAAHTNLDKRFDRGFGMEFANALQLDGVECLTSEDVNSGFGIVGSLRQSKSGAAILAEIKEIFNLSVVKVSNFKEDMTIRKIAFVNGAGIDFLEDAMIKKVDLYITGDVKYHDAQALNGTQIALFDIGHYESEKPYLDVFKELIDEHIQTQGYDLFTKISESEKSQFHYL